MRTRRARPISSCEPASAERDCALRVLLPEKPEKEVPAAPLPAAQADPVAYLAAVVRGEVAPAGLSSLAVNLTVMEILEASRESAATGKRVDLPGQP